MFKAVWFEKLDTLEEDGESLPTPYTVIRRFRNKQRDKSVTKVAEHGAFAAIYQNQSIEDNNSKGKNKDKKKDKRRTTEKKQPRECLCGKTHWFSEFPYLSESARPNAWVPSKDTQRKVEEQLAKPYLKNIVDKALKKSKEIAKRTRKSNATETQTDNPIRSFMVMSVPNVQASYTASSSLVYPLRNSFLLDSGAPIHICNDRSRFINLTQCHDTLFAGSNKDQIEGYGSVSITAQLEKGTQTFTLRDVAYVSTFHANIVSFQRYKAAEGHWDTINMFLMYKNTKVAKVQEMYGQFILEYNKINSQITQSTGAAFPIRSALARRPSEATANIWHQRMGHLHHEALSHLSTSTEGVKITPCSTLLTCQTCHLSKAKQIVSRRQVSRMTTPFARVHFDLIQITPAFNGPRWILHFLDDYTRMNFIYTLSRKTQATQTVIEFHTYVRIQYGCHINVFHTDGETALGGEFDRWVKWKGIAMEISAPYTPAQNGAAEKSGGVIMTRARAIRIEASLPTDIWPEIVQTAGYLINRSPSQRLNWKTPFELL